MSVSKFKRALWALKEFADAAPRGISAQELSNKWEYSSMNDEKEPGIPERTFHRVRRNVESVFGVKIDCFCFNLDSGFTRALPKESTQRALCPLFITHNRYPTHRESRQSNFS